jgi:hypothetical protein
MPSASTKKLTSKESKSGRKRTLKKKASKKEFTVDGKLKKKGPKPTLELQLQEPDAETNFEQIVRAEYMKLHREYRLMENARAKLTQVNTQ